MRYHRDMARYIRNADTGEAKALSELAMLSKAHWGYDEGFMEACRQELAVSPEEIESDLVRLVCEKGGNSGEPAIQGFSHCIASEDAWLVDAFFVHPHCIGQGLGRMLWEDLELEIRKRGGAVVEVESDPNAEEFYRAMGLSLVGRRPSGSIPGRTLPYMRKTL